MFEINHSSTEFKSKTKMLSTSSRSRETPQEQSDLMLLKDPITSLPMRRNSEIMRRQHSEINIADRTSESGGGLLHQMRSFNNLALNMQNRLEVPRVVRATPAPFQRQVALSTSPHSHSALSKHLNQSP